MVFSLIVILLLVIFLALFIGKNLTYVCTFWLIKTYTDLPVAVLALIAFGCGVVVSLLIFLMTILKKAAAKDKVVGKEDAEKKKKNKVEKELKWFEKKNKNTGKSKVDSNSDENKDSKNTQDDK